MAITYEIDQDAGVVRVRCWGTLTNQEMLDCVERLHSDPQRRPGMPSIADCREVQQMQVTPAALQAAATIVNVLSDPMQVPWALAVVAPEDEVYWAARTYEVLRAGSPETIRVFRDALEAEGWLQQQMVG